MRILKIGVLSILTAGLLAAPAGTTVAQTEVTPEQYPAAVTGTVSPVSVESMGSGTLIEGFGSPRENMRFDLRENMRFESTWEASDDRLSGTSTVVANRLVSNPYRMQFGSGASILENEGGRWLGPVTFIEGERVAQAETYVLKGADGYEGLSAVVVVERPSGPDGGEFRAVIFPGELPEVPTLE